MTDEPTLSVSFSFDTTRGVYIGRVASATFFLVGTDFLAKPFANALEALRRKAMLSADNAMADRLASQRGSWSDEDGKALAEAIRRYEAKGGRVQTAGPVPPTATRPRATADNRTTPLSLEDLGL